MEVIGHDVQKLSSGPSITLSLDLAACSVSRPNPCFDLLQFLEGPTPREPIPFFKELYFRTYSVLRHQPLTTIWNQLFTASEEAQVKYFTAQFAQDKKWLERHMLMLPHEANLPLTPMLVMIWRGHVKALDVLLTNKMAVKRDQAGWTEVHWAALSANPAILKVFEMHKYKLDWEKLRTKWGSRPLDILTFSHFPQQASVSIDGSTKHLNSEEYQQAVVAHYTPYTVWTPRALYELREHKPIPSLSKARDLLEKSLEKQVERNLTQGWDYTFSISPVLTDDSGNSVTDRLKGQVEARATRDIPKGTVLCLYAGLTKLAIGAQLPEENGKEMLVSDHLPSHFIDASKAGSGGQFLNHGPPNCFTSTILIRGIPQRAIWTLRAIKENEPLRFVYSTEFIKRMGSDYVELGPREIQDYLQETEFLAEVSSIVITNKQPPTRIGIYHQQGRCFLGEAQVLEEDLIEREVDSTRHRNMLTYLFCHDVPVKLVKTYNVPANRLIEILQLLKNQQLLSWFDSTPSHCDSLLVALSSLQA